MLWWGFQTRVLCTSGTGTFPSPGIEQVHGCRECILLMLVFQTANNSEQLLLFPLFQSKLQGWVDFADGYKGGSKILIFHISFKLGLELVSWCIYLRKCTIWSLSSSEQTIGNAAPQWDTEMLCAPPVTWMRKLRHRGTMSCRGSCQSRVA